MSEKQAAYNAGETETIKPCPFCGEPNNLAVVRNPGDVFVRCLSCDARGPKAKNMDDAIMLHNAAANALDAAKAERDALQERCNVYTEQMQTYGRINEYCAKLEGDLYTASWQRDKLAEKLDEAKRIAALRLTDCETMAEEVEKYKGILQGERQSFVACCADLISQRDEAREWAIKLWREKQAEKQCPACRGDGYVIVDIMGYSNGRMQKCFVCNGTGKVTK